MKKSDLPQAAQNRLNETRTLTVENLNKGLFASSAVGMLEIAMLSIVQARDSLATYNREAAEALKGPITSLLDISQKLVDETAQTLQVMTPIVDETETNGKSN